MKIYDYEAAFQAWDKTSPAMRRAIASWFQLYYGAEATEESDPSQRVAYTIVNKLVKTVFGEYKTSVESAFVQNVLTRLNGHAKTAMQLALVGGECYIKPCPDKDGFSFTLMGRDQVLIFGRNADGCPTDIGTVERSTRGKFYYTLLERRRVDEQGCLIIENQLYRSLNGQNLGSRVPLTEHPDYENLAAYHRYQVPIWSVGVVQMRTPILNCVDGSQEGVSVYAPAVGLIRNIDRNEAQMNGEFSRGESRVFASADLLRPENGLQDHLFVGLDDDPERVGMTVFSPALRESSYLARKQEYLRNVESVVGLKRGMISDANADDRTATEITASAGDYNLTVMEFQQMWERAMRQTVELCCKIASLYNIAQIKTVPQVTVDWGNGVLYDEEQTWEAYRTMVKDGLLKPEIALGWRFNMPTDTPCQIAAVREKLMPEEAP